MADGQLMAPSSEIAAGATKELTETADIGATTSTHISDDMSTSQAFSKDISVTADHTEESNGDRKRKSYGVDDVEEMLVSPKRARTLQVPLVDLQEVLGRTDTEGMASQTVEGPVIVQEIECNSNALSTLPPPLPQEHSGTNGIAKDTAQSTSDSDMADKIEDSSSPLSSVPSSLNSPITTPSLTSTYEDAAEKGNYQISSSNPLSLKGKVLDVVVNDNDTEPLVSTGSSKLTRSASAEADSFDAPNPGCETPQHTAVTGSIELHSEPPLGDNVATAHESAGGSFGPRSLSLIVRTNRGQPSASLPRPSSTGSGEMYEFVKTGGRVRKQPERYGKLVSTVISVTDTETPISDTVTGADSDQDSNGTAAKRTHATPKRATTRMTNMRSALLPSKVRQLARSPKIAKPRTKSSSRPKTTPAFKAKTTSAFKTGPTAVSMSSVTPAFKPKTTPASKSGPINSSSLARYLAKNRPVPVSTGTGRKKSWSLVVSLPISPLEAGDQKLALSRKLTARNELHLKPESQGHPEVWAESRQALCETLPYFKSPQSGCYQNDGHVYGFLFDSIGHCREYMDENVIICRAGGGMEADGNGGMVQKRDHSMQEAQVKAVLNDKAHHNPLVVICGNRNAAAPCKMPHQYCVLGWYKPVLVWTEKTAGKGDKVWNTVKYRLERLNSHKPVWHAPNDSSVTEEERAIAGTLTRRVCIDCHVESPQVYLRAWMCLNATCDEFWKINGRSAPCGTQCLEYNPAFLLSRSPMWAATGSEEEPEPAPLKPAVPDIGNAIGDNLTYINTRGICCPKCGRCNSRRLFKGWRCENTACDFDLPAVHQAVAPAKLHTPWDVAPTLLRNRYAPGVCVKVEHKYGYKISTYTFPSTKGDGIKGSFIHAAATKQILQEARGANNMFAALQVEDMGLERRTFAVKRISNGQAEKEISKDTHSSSMAAQTTKTGDVAPTDRNLDTSGADEEIQRKAEFADGDLMTAFSMNYGMPYKFVASGGSRPFEDGPWPVAETRRRLNWTAQKFLNKPDEDMDFNEELIFAYLEGQKIEYHDDGEKGLGPRIATLSLGGRAKMHMRMKMKHYVGCTKTGILTEERPVPACMEYEKRLEAWNELQKLKADSKTYNQRAKEIPKELGIFEKRNKQAEDLVTITLSHGDIVIMDGYDIQKYLEHKVVPEGYLRFALTCRTVLEDHLKPEERPDYEVKKDDQTYDGPKI